MHGNRIPGEYYFQNLKVKACNAILSHFKPKALFDLSDRYHRNIARYEDRLETVSLTVDWPGMIGNIDLGNGIVARELTSSRQFKIQGAKEKHCIGGYVRQVLTGNVNGQATLVFSIEKNTGKETGVLGTVEFSCREKPCPSDVRETKTRDRELRLQISINQHRARRNTPVSQMAHELAGQVAAKIEQAGPEKFRSYLKGLSRVRDDEQDHLLSGPDPYVHKCGFDPYDPVMLERAWQELSPALPRELRKMGLEAFIDTAEIQRTSVIVPDSAKHMKCFQEDKEILKSGPD